MERRRKRIRFPLEMKEGRKVRDLDELKEYFDLRKAVEYFCSGKLQTWLENNVYASDIVKELNELTGEEEDFIKRFSDALGVKCEEEINVKEIIHNSFLRERLKRFYPEEESEIIVEKTADTQERFEQLIKEGYREIYLLSGTFTILKKMKGLRLTGVDSPKIVIKAQTAEEFRKQEIILKSVYSADEETKKIMLGDGLFEAKELLEVLELYLRKRSQEEEKC